MLLVSVISGIMCRECGCVSIGDSVISFRVLLLMGDSVSEKECDWGKGVFILCEDYVSFKGKMSRFEGGWSDSSHGVSFKGKVSFKGGVLRSDGIWAVSAQSVTFKWWVGVVLLGGLSGVMFCCR